jgi:drug/metabolite transporter (DMT)-like permease
LWSATANAVKTRLTGARVAALLLTIAGALLAAAAGQLAHDKSALGTIVAVTGAVAVGLAPLVLRLAGSKAVHVWTRARAISQALTAEIYTYMAGVSPYRGPQRDHELIDRVFSVLDKGEDLLRYTAR